MFSDQSIHLELELVPASEKSHFTGICGNKVGKANLQELSAVSCILIIVKFSIRKIIV